MAYIALGSNLGDRAGTIARALALLDATPGIHVTASSALLETPSEGGPPDAPPYLNAAAELETTLEPWPLLERLMEVEQALGRRRPDLPNAPRPVDLDLLLYDDLVCDDPRLTLPHPRLHLRRFVLQPLVQIAPDHVHPILRHATRKLLVDLEPDR